MVFSSLSFIFRFLPIFLFLYYIVPERYRNLILLLGSICFYSVGEPVFILLLLCSVLINYKGALLIEDAKKQSTKKMWFLLTLFYDFGMLIFFKYINFIIETVNMILNGAFHIHKIAPLSIALPLGISFYTFQVVSYIINVYTDKIYAERSLFYISLYVCMFPQLISGPIVEYQYMDWQFFNRQYSLRNIEKGLKLFTIGLGFKILLADRIGILWNDIQTIGFESISTPLAWLGAAGYSLQLYFDFHGYTLMAIGVAKMLGFSMPSNFSHPYMSKSVSEFWRRWHITLGKWFKNYVYIPLGGNRKGKWRTAVNLFLVWMFTGLWHGANWNFVLWGFVLFLLILMEKLFLKKYLERSGILARIYVIAVMPMTWMIFAITKFADLKTYFGRLFALTPGVNVNSFDFIKYITEYKVLFLAGVFFSVPLAWRWYLKHENSIPCIIILVIVFWYSIYHMANGMNNPFLYFKF
jgi:Predicted membrane protein involved in D-alanine export